MGDHKAFFYGTLMAPEVLHRVCYGTSTPSPFQKSLLTIRPAILHNYVRRKVKFVDYPAIIPGSSFKPISTTSSSSALNPSSPSSSPNPSTSTSTSTDKSSNKSVRGTLVTGLTDGDIWRLDIFEGDEYIRKTVHVFPLRTIGDDEGVGNIEEENSVEVQTYIWIAGEHGLEDDEWDFGNFVREKMWRWAGNGAEGEGEFDEVDKAVEMEKDGVDPTGGRGGGGAITQDLKARGGDGDLRAAV